MKKDNEREEEILSDLSKFSFLVLLKWPCIEVDVPLDSQFKGSSPG